MVDTIVLVSCVKTKHERKMPARELYCSDWFIKASKFAAKISDKWYILSAKHHLLDPEKEIEPYCETLKDMSIDQQKSWANQVINDLRKNEVNGKKIVILAGEVYRKFLIDSILEMGCQVEIPMEGLGIGLQKQWLKNQLLDP